jgi:hypothetical protein
MYGCNNPMDLLNQKVDIEKKLNFPPLVLTLLYEHGKLYTWLEGISIVLIATTSVSIVQC